MTENSKIEWTDQTFNPWEDALRARGNGGGHLMPCYLERTKDGSCMILCGNLGPPLRRRKVCRFF